MPTEMELTLKHTQQDVSYEVSVSIEWVEEGKRNVRIKGVKKEALHTLRQKPGLIRSGYHQKDRKPSQNDKTEHGMEKTVQNQGQ
ncbi:hypothetical protein Tco_0284186, partial [Tanacetum coccineum]